MKRNFGAGFLGLVLVGLLFSPGSGQTSDEILKKMLEAQGGREALESVKDLTITGSIELVQQGLSGDLTVYKKEPDKRRTDLVVMGMTITQCYDGKIAWWVNPQTGTTEEVSGEQAADLKRQAMPMTANLEPAKYGLSFLLKGKELLEGKEYVVLEETYPDGLIVLLYVDPETNFIHKMKSKIHAAGAEFDFEQILSDYRKDGLMTMAHSVLTYQNGTEYSRIAFKEVKFNIGIPDTMFEMAK